MLQNNGLTSKALINGKPQVTLDDLENFKLKKFQVEMKDIELTKNDLEANESRRSSISSGKSSHFSVNSIENKVRRRVTNQLETADL